jgi:hypothetical protein
VRIARFLFAFGLMLSSSAIASRADAFCRTRTVDAVTCGHTDSNGCTPCGAPTWWKSACVSFDVQRNGTRTIPFDEAAATVSRSFQNWTSVRCPQANGAAPLRVSVDAVDLGPVRCDQAQYDDSGPNQNVVVFHDDAWPHKSQHEIDARLASPDIALTTVTYDKGTGEIWDADIELNTAEHTIVVNVSPAPGTFDLESILTHEIGHFFGLGHSPLPDAVMYYQDEGGSSRRRNLAPDDIDAICNVYPPGGARAVDSSLSNTGYVKDGACDPTPRHGFTSDCTDPHPRGCSIGEGSKGAPFAFALAAIFWGCALRRASRPRAKVRR